MLQYRDSISAICIAAAWSDGTLGEMEKQALDRIHVMLEYPRYEIMERIGDAVKNGPSGESVDIPNDESIQLEFMRFALVVCLADGDINQHEVNFLSKLAGFLSVSREKLEYLKQKAQNLLNPGQTDRQYTAPERLEALLPEQKVKLAEETPTAAPKRETYDPKACTRKPLSELLFQGEDYGGELSLS